MNTGTAKAAIHGQELRGLTFNNSRSGSAHGSWQGATNMQATNMATRWES